MQQPVRCTQHSVHTSRCYNMLFSDYSNCYPSDCMPDNQNSQFVPEYGDNARSEATQFDGYSNHSAPTLLKPRRKSWTPAHDLAPGKYLITNDIVEATRFTRFTW